MRLAKAIHVVEKGLKIENLRQLQGNDDPEVWETGYWIISDETAQSLIDGMVYVHRGQNLPSHAGGKIIAIYHEAGTEPKRRVIRFRSSSDAKDVVAGRSGWGNERKLIWKDE